MLELRNHLTEVNAVIKSLQNVSLHVNAAPPPQRIRQAAVGESSSVVSDIHWLLELPDELDILTSERLFESAVSLVEKAEKMRDKEKRGDAVGSRYDAVFKSIKEAYDERVAALSASLLKDLQNPALKKTESRTVITYLTRLGYAKTAREIFLETRSRKIRYDLFPIFQAQYATSSKGSLLTFVSYQFLKLFSLTYPTEIMSLYIIRLIFIFLSLGLM